MSSSGVYIYIIDTLFLKKNIVTSRKSLSSSPYFQILLVLGLTESEFDFKCVEMLQ